MHLPALLVDTVDLVLGRACLLCDHPGRVLCGACLTGLRGSAGLLAPLEALPPVTAALPYAGDGARLILAYKEHGNRALAPMLGMLLADAIAAHPALRGRRRCTIVPVPGHRRARRGFDALGDICTVTATALTAGDRIADVARIVRSTRPSPPLKSLAREERHRAIDGAFVARHRYDVASPVIVVDDVLTTGATVRETMRALQSVRIATDGVAVIADASSIH